jgi:hypothetical protein
MYIEGMPLAEYSGEEKFGQIEGHSTVGASEELAMECPTRRAAGMLKFEF